MSGMTESDNATALQESGAAADQELSESDAGRTAETCGHSTWIQIQLIGEDDQPIPGAKYRAELPDGSIREGTLDEKGIAGFDGISAGDCKVSFPELDQEAWTPAEAADASGGTSPG
jgi:hypothetical protein